MVNRDNWLLTKKYLSYAGARRSERTIARERSGLRHFLEWLDAASVFNAHKIKIAFPGYLAEVGVGPAGTNRACLTASNFLKWLRRREPRRSSKINDLWEEEFIKPYKCYTQPRHDAYTLGEIEQLVAVCDDRLYMTRTIGATALMFLSGMRAGAMVTVPIELIDLEAREVYQWADRGVMTKGSKSATTYLLNLPHLIEAADRWDRIVRARLPAASAWYAPLVPGGDRVSLDEPGKNRTVGLGRAVRALCDLAGVRYRGVHQIRHGHATYAMALCRDVADYKAVSLNLMHDDITTTDRIYAEMKGSDVKRRIEALSQNEG